ncbi:putative pentatricopeptide repeat protein [Erysiphe necator]|uniref:Putative pentatricopeptide repeat protein n=1 Tax=Uncinula necator TaxID=52586 RepID=A0A0B1PHC7_UNCNE|nr:putative pentatricopeptide repeat protein [Erysiphe necator]
MKDRYDLAVKTVRTVSRSIQCVVSWNHLIDWLMSKGKMKSAFKIYHEMKKRANVPDAYTYTILFRGCSKNPHSKQALGKAMAVYQSMLRDKSPVKPNIIHMNTILKLCAVSGDLDSMLYFLDGLPSSGAKAADAATFSTVLNALRHNAVSPLPTPPSIEQRKQQIQTMVLQARQIWKGILKRWRKGDMWIDEELVCSMGRILLTSDDNKHWDEILTIIEQTMGISRQLPPFVSNWQDQGDIKDQIQKKSISFHSSSNDQTFETDFISKSDSSPDFHTTPQLTPLSLSVIPEASKFARPGKNSISLVLSALLQLSSKEPATRYWKIFTEKYEIQPDLENYVSYLRVLRAFRASSESLQLLISMPPEFLEAKVFRIAISSCVRDKYNHHAFSNAGKILDLMQKSLKQPDVSTILRYLELAVSLPLKSKLDPSSNKATISDGVLGSQILRALDRVQQLILNIKSYMFFGDMGLEFNSNKYEYLQNFEKLIQKSIQAYNLLLKKRMVPDYLFTELRAQIHKLSHLIIRISKYRKSFGGNPSKTYEPEI